MSAPWWPARAAPGRDGGSERAGQHLRGRPAGLCPDRGEDPARVCRVRCLLPPSNLSQAPGLPVTSLASETLHDGVSLVNLLPAGGNLLTVGRLTLNAASHFTLARAGPASTCYPLQPYSARSSFPPLLQTQFPAAQSVWSLSLSSPAWGSRPWRGSWAESMALLTARGL